MKETSLQMGTFTENYTGHKGYIYIIAPASMAQEALQKKE